MTTIINGAIGGLLVGAIGALVVGLLRDSVDFGGLLDRLGLSRGAALGLLTAYGGIAGATLVAAELIVLRILSVPPGLGIALGLAIAWSGLLAICWLAMSTVVSSSTARRPLGTLLAYHAVFGVGFGLWIRLTWIT